MDSAVTGKVKGNYMISRGGEFPRVHGPVGNGPNEPDTVPRPVTIWDFMEPGIVW